MSEKENLSENDILFQDELKLFDKEPAEAISEVPSDVKVVHNEPDKREEKRKENKKRKKEKKAEKQKKYPNTLSFLLGAVVLIFAILGIVLTIWNSARYIGSKTQSESEFAKYNSFLIPIAAADPDSFDDIGSANTQQLLNCALWAIIDNDSTPDKYEYSGGYLLIPKSDVESVYAALFGNDSVKNLVHRTVNSYNCTFEYNATALVYQIPITAVSPVYTPQVVSVEESGSSLIVTVNYLAAESWNQDSEGNFIAPEPDKTVNITLRENNGVYFVASIKTVSATVPDVVIPEQNVVSREPESDIETTEPETTTAQTEKITLGGRI